MLTLAYLARKLSALGGGYIEPPQIVSDEEQAQINRERAPEPLICSTCGGKLHWTSVGIVCMECDR